MNKNEIFEKIYFNINNPGSFGGIRKLYEQAKEIDKTISLNDTKIWLSAQPQYTLFKESRNNFERNRIYVSYINEQWEIDIVDYAKFSRYNRIKILRDGKLHFKTIKYLITIIDVFSKYAYVMPVESKSMKIICDNFADLFKKIHPTKIRSDRGKEFDNLQFKLLCKKYGIIYFTTQNSTKKCAVVERFNKTIKNKIERIMSNNRSRRYVDHLKAIVTTYNNTVHNSTHMKPSDISYENESIVFKNLFGEKNFMDILRNNSSKGKFKTGDTVRIKYDPKAFDKGYRQNWTDKVYKVQNILKKTKKPQYEVSYSGQLSKRRFYPEELQKVRINSNTLWPIEKVLRKRVKDNKVEVLVKWKGFTNQDNTWIPIEHLQKR